jgi:3-dehydroquinate dehydratase-1
MYSRKVMKYKTCASIVEKNPNELNLILNKALKKSDYAEIRFDFLKPVDIQIEFLHNRIFLMPCLV